ncbi:RGG repeats nuclear RNA binding protein A-like [Camellia sinensis]|nr:RGG repeats nuclear RNA binding protein A-like [Camellia sinensis]
MYPMLAASTPLDPVIRDEGSSIPFIRKLSQLVQIFNYRGLEETIIARWVAEKPQEDATDVNKENTANEAGGKEPEDKEMTLEEYEKVLEEKRKALLALKTEERKVAVDKELASMQQLSSKKDNNDIFVKLGSDKDKRKELAEKEEKSKKSVSINEFLKPAGDRYYSPDTRGRDGRGRDSRGGYGGGGDSRGGYDGVGAK